MLGALAVRCTSAISASAEMATIAAAPNGGFMMPFSPIFVRFFTHTKGCGTHTREGVFAV